MQAKEFDLDFSGQADQVQVPNIDFGSTEPGASIWSVDELLRFISEHMSCTCDQQVSLESTLKVLQNFL